MSIIDKIKAIVNEWTNPTIEVKVKMEQGCKTLLPSKAHTSDAGFDLFSAENCIIAPNETRIVSTGVRMEIPMGYELQVRARSGLAAKKYVVVANAPGTVDAGYRNVIGVILRNEGKFNLEISKGDRIAQGVFCKLPNVVLKRVTSLGNSDRGENGFGSTGK